jgi:hypothetical protein
MTQAQRPPLPSPRALHPLHWLLFALGVLASVATNLAEPPASADTDAATSTCANDEDCAQSPDTLRCLSTYSLCVECVEDSHCDTSSRCHQSRCVSRCEDSSACPNGLICKDNLCQDCAADNDCADPSQYCYQGESLRACRPLCSSSAQCDSPGYDQGAVCRGGRCQASPCAADTDCVLNQERCDLQSQQCRPIGSP